MVWAHVPQSSLHPQIIKEFLIDKNIRRYSMNTNQDRLVAVIGVCAGIILLSVLFADHLPLPIHTFACGIAIQILFAILVQRSLLSTPSAKPYRIAYAAVSAFMTTVVLGILSLDLSLSDPRILVGGMEPATALLVFGISLGPFAYVFLWITTFHQSILSKHTLQHLEKRNEKCEFGIK